MGIARPRGRSSLRSWAQRRPVDTSHGNHREQLVCWTKREAQPGAGARETADRAVAARPPDLQRIRAATKGYGNQRPVVIDAC
jgi:hypothetical protein